MKTNRKGIAGVLASGFIHSKLTPLIAVFSILLGISAVLLTPKEEEPQISVPMIDISLQVPGLEADEVERKVVEPVERAVWGLEGVEYVYSSSRAHFALITVRFKVGEPMEPSLIKVHHQIMRIRPDLPYEVSEPAVHSYTIDDVPFLVLTFSSAKSDSLQLRSLIAPLAREFSSTPDLSRVELKGGLKRTVRVIVDPAQLSRSGVSLLAVEDALRRNHISMPSGKDWSRSRVYDVEFGGRLATREDVQNVAIGQRAGRVVRIRDIARVVEGPEELLRASTLVEHEKPGRPEQAVSIVFSKRKGTNVVDLADRLLGRAQMFTRQLPEDVHMKVLRNYGETANQKSKELIEHLLIATLSVAALIALAMGLRAAWVVAIAIPVTLALTLGIYYFLGYTLNRITLFALIFSIGILVDDAIVVVENIERHLSKNPERGMFGCAVDAVSEVGNPTILATFTVIAAILPMAFVRGMMGPYMKPIPVGASLAMLFSLGVAFVVTPWAATRILKRHSHSSSPSKEGHMDRVYRKLMDYLLTSSRSALGFGVMVLVLLGLSLSLLPLKAAKVKMLPFDNKNEFQVLVDFPPGTPFFKTQEQAQELAQRLAVDSEVKRVQVFVGESAPFSFSGMVKHSYLRGSDDQADLHVVLTGKSERRRSSHEVIEALRPVIREFSVSSGAITRILEIPPGPPVLATLVAEIYGPSREVRDREARTVEAQFRSEPSVVDLDTSLRQPRGRVRYSFDYGRGGEFGANGRDFAKLGNLIFSESKMGSLNEAEHPEEIGIVLSVENQARSGREPLRSEIMPSFEAGVVEVKALAQGPQKFENPVLYRKNLKAVSYVMAELSGSEESPVYGILKLSPKIKIPAQTADVPSDTSVPVLKWDGEWFITYEVFRDLGAAFAAVIVLIYILVLAWFRSYAVPLVIMAPIPISLIGILPGHALLGAYFTATSMIGFIAGAGIIVRNSIILVDFIEEQILSGEGLKEAVVGAGVLRFRPMLLTAAAVVVGGAVMLRDPIFQGLAISLMFGEIAATLFSRFAVPVLYYWFIGEGRVNNLRRLNEY